MGTNSNIETRDGTDTLVCFSTTGTPLMYSSLERDPLWLEVMSEFSVALAFMADRLPARDGNDIESLRWLQNRLLDLGAKILAKRSSLQKGT